MTEAFGWYLLAGFFIGFSISTLWEWLYFRRRRMAIRNRRIAELEAALRTYAAAATPTQTGAATTNDWGEPQFENPHVYLETEESVQIASEQPVTPDPNSVRTAQSSAFVGAAAARKSPLDREPPDPAKVQESEITQQAPPPVAPFRSVAVQPPAPAADAKPQSQPPASSPVHHAQSTEAAAVASTMTATQYPVAAQPSTAQDATASPTTASPKTASLKTASPKTVSPKTVSPAPTGHGQTVNVVYANGYATPRGAENPYPTTVQTSATGHRAITGDDLDALAASINELISTLNRASVTTKEDAAVEWPLHTAHNQAAPAPPSGRMERVLVRLVQAMAQFLRQVRTIISGREAPAPYIGVRASDADDLTLIDGLTPEYAERLRVAGVTTFARLAALSPDELRLLTLTPGGGGDVEQWRAQAARLAGANQEFAQP